MSVELAFQIDRDLLRKRWLQNPSEHGRQHRGRHVGWQPKRTGGRRETGMQYVSIPWHPDSPSDENIARFLKVIEENPDKKVFVHCHAGVDRTGMAIASYRMAKEGWSPDEAMK
jgi:Dual specificity phosphatase, catalytic domain